MNEWMNEWVSEWINKLVKLWNVRSPLLMMILAMDSWKCLYLFTEFKIYHEEKKSCKPMFAKKISGNAFGLKKKFLQKKNCPPPPPSNLDKIEQSRLSLLTVTCSHVTHAYPIVRSYTTFARAFAHPGFQNPGWQPRVWQKFRFSPV